MFNGLITKIAKIQSLNGDILTLQCDYTPKIGDSISVNGACLTATQINRDGFCVQVSPHTKKTLSPNKLQGYAHIEPAMKLGDKIDGHFLQGHIDYIGTIQNIQKSENCYDFYIKMPQEALLFCAPKGSIGIDGVSLTISEVKDDIIKIAVITHTFNNTLLCKYKINEQVNCESDMFARYIYNILNRQKSSTNDKNDKNEKLWNQIDGMLARY